MGDKRYIILGLSDAKALAAAVHWAYTDHLAPVLNRIAAETGADIEDIASQLKRQPSCHACRVEGQEHNCINIEVKKLGRRLQRLIDRAQPKAIEDETNIKEHMQ